MFNTAAAYGGPQNFRFIEKERTGMKSIETFSFVNFSITSVRCVSFKTKYVKLSELFDVKNAPFRKTSSPRFPK